jgi:hypothetical protein
LPRHRAIIGIVIACATALAAAGCNNAKEALTDKSEGGWFSKPVDMLAKPDWARPTTGGVNLGPQGPVTAEDMVSADGQCAMPAAAVAQAAEASPVQPPAPADRPVGSVAGDLAGAPMPAATKTSAGPGLERLDMAPSAAAPVVSGGISLGMTECQTVQRAGSPSNVAISAGEKGERRVVRTYLSGPWPGIYTFNDGRLKVVERAPEQPKPAKAAPKKKPVKPKTASHEIERAVVR